MPMVLRVVDFVFWIVENGTRFLQVKLSVKNVFAVAPVAAAAAAKPWATPWFGMLLNVARNPPSTPKWLWTTPARANTAIRAHGAKHTHTHATTPKMATKTQFPNVPEIPEDWCECQNGDGH